MARYRVEPYVVAADIASEPPLVGRGGWTWYTGSAGWLYRVALETLLGFQPQGNALHLEPCIAAAWTDYEITFRHRTATYHLVVRNPRHVERGVKTISVDGKLESNRSIALVDDGRQHEIEVELG